MERVWSGVERREGLCGAGQSDPASVRLFPVRDLRELLPGHQLTSIG